MQGVIPVYFLFEDLLSICFPIMPTDLKIYKKSVRQTV